jgi:protein-S-isoprenylcysteine O-methyltransferase Ste14
MIFHLALLICWSAFLLVWISGALYNRIKGPKIVQVRRKYIVAGVFSAIIIYVLAFIFRRNYVPILKITTFHSLPLQVLGTIFLMVSTSFTIWARFALGRMWSLSPALKEEHSLRTSGPYKITRHPIYTGLFAMIAATTLAIGNVLPILFLGIIAFTLKNKIAAEEKIMIEEFGNQYLEYQKQVPKLIPRLFPRFKKPFA